MTILYKKAIEKEKDNLAQAILIACYTGCRIKEICRFTTSDIVEEKGIKCFFVRKGKTKSSTRMIPVHPHLLRFVDNLCKNADEDGFLIHTTKGNKYNKKSDAVSKAFKRIKDECGYNSDHVFHSFRKNIYHAITAKQRTTLCHYVTCRASNIYRDIRYIQRWSVCRAKVRSYRDAKIRYIIEI